MRNDVHGNKYDTTGVKSFSGEAELTNKKANKETVYKKSALHAHLDLAKDAIELEFKLLR